MTTRRLVLTCTAATAAVVLVSGAPALAAPTAPAAPTDPAASTAAAQLPRTGSSAVALTGFLAGVAGTAVDPTASPLGVNVPGCRLTARHPRPVVLVNGTFTVMQTSFGTLGPRLAAAGYCVYGYNYGTADPYARVQALGPVRDGVAALADQVTRVRQATGATQVDLVGYSQGGLIAEAYTKSTGAAAVHSVTALAPTTHGTTLLGLATAAKYLPGALPTVQQGCAACVNQVVGSAFVRALNTGPVTVPGVRYTVIDTRHEDVVTPTGSSFIREPGVVNEYVQAFDASDVHEHVILPFNPVTGDRVLAALTRAGS